MARSAASALGASPNHVGGLPAGRLLAHLMKASGLVASGKVTSAEAWEVSSSWALQQRGVRATKRVSLLEAAKRIGLGLGTFRGMGQRC